MSSSPVGPGKPATVLTCKSSESPAHEAVAVGHNGAGFVAAGWFRQM